jgi:hypothetical protein
MGVGIYKQLLWIFSPGVQGAAAIFGKIFMYRKITLRCKEWSDFV